MNQTNEQESIEPLPKAEARTLFPPTELMQGERKKRLKGKCKVSVIWGLWFAGLFVLQYALGRDFKSLAMSLLIVFIVVWLGIYFLVTLHEFGHVVMGWLAGKRLLVFCFGRWRLEHTLGGWRWRRPRAIGGVGGFCVMVPAEPGQPVNRLGEIGFFLGGSLANLVFAALLWGIFKQQIFSNSIFNDILLGVMGITLLLGVFNLLPLNLKNGWRTDGRLAWDLLRNRQEDDFKIVKELSEFVYFNIRPRDWQAEHILRLGQIQLEGKPFVLQCSVNILKFQYACDRKSWTEAEPAAYWLAQNFMLIPNGQRQGVAAAMALYALYGKNDQRLFEAWQIWCDDAALLNLRAYRALFNAWLAYFAGEYEQAQQAIEETRLAMPGLLFQQGVVYVQECLDDLQAHLQRVCSLKIVQ